MLLLSDEIQVPQRVVEDDQYVGQRMERGEDFGQARVRGFGGELFEGPHPFDTGIAGQFVDAEVKRLLAAAIGPETVAPLDRDRNMPSGGHGTQQHGRGDVVVVGNGNQRSEPQFFNLLALEIER